MMLILVQPWRGWSPFRSAEILIVPAAVGILLLPIFGLVVEGSGDVWLDAEPIPGLAQFLRAFQVRNRMFMRIHEYSAADRDPGINREMAADLEQISREGDVFYSPFRDLDDKGGKCLSVFLGEEYATDCEVF